MEYGIKGKTAVILGSSKGIGFASALKLAGEGCNVVLHGRSAETLKVARDEVIGKYPDVNVDLVIFDLSNKNEVSSFIGKIKRKEIKCDILINNSGGPVVKPLLDVTDKEWLLFSESMMFPIIAITKAAVSVMKDKGWGRVLTLVSSGVVQPMAELGISNTYRSALVAFSKTLSNEVASLGITVNCVIPGRISTNRLKEVEEARALKLGVSIEEMQRLSFSTIPTRRYGTPDEIANAICFLASDGSSYITGSTLRVDGGSIASL